jgi:hypothetical protein
VTTPGSGSFLCGCGSTVPVCVTPADCDRFTGWSGTAVDNGRVADPTKPCTTVTMDENYTLIANFTVKQHCLTITATEGGRVIAEPGGTVEPNETKTFCYNCGDTVTLTPQNDSNDYFVGWSGDPNLSCDPNGSCRITITSDGTIEGTFEPVDIRDSGCTPGGCVVYPDGKPPVIDCRIPVHVIAKPAPCHHFTGWSGTAVDAGKVDDASAADTMVLVDADYTLIASFAPDDQKMLTVSSDDGGTVTSPGVGPFKYDCGAQVPIVASADESHEFTHWTGTAAVASKVDDPNSPSTMVTVDGDYTLQANFKQRVMLSLKLSTTLGGRIVEPNAPVVVLPAPADVNVIAEADPNCFFWSWQGTAVENGKLLTDVNDPNTTVFVDANDTLRAAFLRWIHGWKDDVVDCGECRGASSSTSQLWDFADAATGVGANGLPEGIYDILGPAPKGQLPLPGTFLTCLDCNTPGAQQWWPGDPYATSGRGGMTASTGLYGSINIPPSPRGTSIWLQVAWRDYSGAKPPLFPSDQPHRPILTTVEPASKIEVSAEFYVQHGWHHTIYVWLVGPNVETVQFTIGGPVIMDSLIVDTCQEGWGRWVEP